MILKLTLPLSIPVSSKKFFILNLNGYRNAHHMTLSKAKEKYTELVMGLLEGNLTRFPGKVELTYTLFVGNRQARDVANICSIVDKFTCDALVKADILTEDNFNVVPTIHYLFGGVDKNQGRVELTIASL